MVRTFLRALLRGVAVLTAIAGFTAAEAQTLRIGIIGTGNIGSSLARHWAAAGHEILISSRHPEELAELARELGPRVRAGLPGDAAEFGDVVVVSVPYAALPQIGTDFGADLAGKIIIDTSNPVERRDGEMALDAQQKGAAIASIEFLGDVRLVRAFNCIPAAALANEGNRAPERIAIPLAGNDVLALAVTERLVAEAGFDSVTIGDLDAGRHFDLGQPLALGTPTAAELRAAAIELGVLGPQQ